MILVYCSLYITVLPDNIVSSYCKGRHRGKTEYQNPQQLLADSNNAAHPGGEGLESNLEGGDGLQHLSLQNNLHTSLVACRLETNMLDLVPLQQTLKWRK